MPSGYLRCSGRAGTINPPDFGNPDYLWGMAAWKSNWDRIPVFVNYALILAVVALIASFFPDKLRFKYVYELGKAWPYEDLYAPFDFAVPKDPDTYQQEVDRLRQQSPPLYKRLDSLEASQIRAFESAFKAQIASLEPSQFPDVQRARDRYLGYGRGFLESLFARGVIEWGPEFPAENMPEAVEIVAGNTSRIVGSPSVLTVGQAKNQIGDSLPYSKLAEPDFLLPLLADAIKANLVYDEKLNVQFREKLVESVSPYQGMVQKNELIIQRGAPITKSVFHTLEGFREQYLLSMQQQKSKVYLFAGYLILTLLVVGVLILYLLYTHSFLFYRLNHLLFILIWPLAFGYFSYLIREESILSPYILPLAIVPMVMKNFYDNRIALYVHLVVVMISSLLSSMGFTFIFLQLLVGVVVVIVRMDTNNWTRFFYTVGLILAVYCLAYFAISLTEEGGIQTMNWGSFSWLFANSFLILLAFPLTSLFERVFGFTSVLRLVELSDTNRPLMQLLAVKAPGTYQHSLQVANLAEAAARAIGADHLLVKVGALYHDMGKTKHPELFIENQNGDNPHHNLSSEESARLIIEHVTEGVSIARKNGLPRIIADFMLTHHGTTRTEFFYQKFLQEHGEAGADQEKQFRYPGPRPVSKEATILMLADTIEAACKSLKNPSVQEIDELVERLVASKGTQGQFEESMLSFGELSTCKQVFRQLLRSIYHARVEYPKESTPAPKQGD